MNKKYFLNETAKEVEKDFLDEIITERTTCNPAFPKMVAKAIRKRSSQKK